ncbi:unnamed protein product [Menidia menidia]|uniref:(Atlantic silverside) hypothetical protein n=1 Tax=Menidia menidia TaxID=238744 RepID=A0A8S4BTT7_9TELE|nr:unnamed protein product [Menidia menidia]
MLSSFDFFSTEEYMDGDKMAISIAFRKFLEEQNKKAQSVRQNGNSAEAGDVDMEKGNGNRKAPAVVSESVSRTHREDTDDEVSLSSFLRASPFLSPEGEEKEEMIIKRPSKSLNKDRYNGDEASKPKSKVSQSALRLFEECFDKWQNAAYPQSANGEVDTAAGETHLSDKHGKAAATAHSKREFAEKFEALPSDTGCKTRKLTHSASAPSSTPLMRRNSDRELFMMRGEDSPLMSSRKPEAKFNVRMDFVGDSLLSSSDILAEERQLSQDLVQASKKDQEFRSIFQHVQAAQSQRSPSELFAQHIVTIVHHTKAQHFQPSGMTLNERFTLYQRQAAEKEMMKPRKSPEIHRRIDVSPSAFKKHPQLYEAMKSSEDGLYKDGGEKAKGDPMDLRLDIERRKKFSTHEKDYNQDRGRDMKSSPDFSKDRSEENIPKFSKRLMKSDKKRSRSSSSSSSSSCKSQKDENLPHDKPESKDEVFDRPWLSQRGSQTPAEGGWLRGGFQIRIRGRGWNKASCQQNSSQSNPVKGAADPNNEDWDPESTPKCKKYYLHDDRDEEPERKWMDNRGRAQGSFPRGKARFIIRKATGSATMNNSKWVFDKFQTSREHGGKEGEEGEQDHKQAEIDGEKT